MEAVDLIKLSEKEFLLAIKRISDDTNHNPAIGMVQIGTMIGVRLKGFEEKQAELEAGTKALMKPACEGSVIDAELVNTYSTPIRINFVLTEQVRINGLDVGFDAYLVENEKEKIDIFDDERIEELMDFVSSEFSWDECNDVISDHWFIVNMLGSNPEAEVLELFKQGKLVIVGMSPELLEEITSDYPGYLARYLAGGAGCGVMVRDLIDEREGYDS